MSILLCSTGHTFCGKQPDNQTLCFSKIVQATACDNWARTTEGKSLNSLCRVQRRACHQSQMPPTPADSGAGVFKAFMNKAHCAGSHACTDTQRQALLKQAKDKSTGLKKCNILMSKAYHSSDRHGLCYRRVVRSNSGVYEHGGCGSWRVHVCTVS